MSLLRWLKEHEPERYAQIGCVMMTHDYLRWCLTGVKGCEESNISESNLYNMSRGEYDPCLTDWLGIAEINHTLPPVVGSAEICGEITAQTAVLTGLKAGTPVVGGLFDVVSTALCAGLEDEFTLNAVMGTWAVTSGITHGLRDGEAHPYVYGRYVNDGQFIVHEASPTSSGNLEWFTAQWGEISFAEINQAVASLPKAGGDLFFLPFLYGSNAGLEMTSGFYGMQAIHTRAHLLQAIYEGVVFSHMTHLNRMRERFTDVHTLRVTGGPAHSDVWMQMLADVSGLRIELPQVEETGCFGAALPPASVPGFIAISAKPNVTYSTRYAPCCRIWPRISFTNKNTNAINISLPHFRVITPASRSTHYESTTSATGPRPLIT